MRETKYLTRPGIVSSVRNFCSNVREVAHKIANADLEERRMREDLDKLTKGGFQK